MAENRKHPSRRELIAGATLLTAAAATIPTASAGDKKHNFGGKSVLITGTSSGFGYLTALHLARHGATVYASMRNLKGGKRPEAQKLMDIANDEDLKLSVIEIDVTKPDQVANGVASAQMSGGALDVLVNNAGIAIGGPVEMHDDQSINLIYDTNVYGYQRMARAVLAAMRQKKAGQIFNVSSQLGRMVIPNVGLYCSTKHAVEAMFEAMAYELAPHGVEVTIIQPGGYPTKIWENAAKNADALISRTNPERLAAYEAHLNITRGMMSAPRATDPMDIPHAISEIMAMPAGTRPLRRPVHPNTQGPDAINGVTAQVQAGALSSGAYASWHKAVTD